VNEPYANGLWLMPSPNILARDASRRGRRQADLGGARAIPIRARLNPRSASQKNSPCSERAVRAAAWFRRAFQVGHLYGTPITGLWHCAGLTREENYGGTEGGTT